MIQHRDPKIQAESELDLKITTLKVWSWRKFGWETKYVGRVCWHARGWNVLLFESEPFDSESECREISEFALNYHTNVMENE